MRLSCNLCQKSYLVEEYDLHLSTEIHLRYAELDRTYFCEICRSPASGKIPFIAHIQGKQHEKEKHKLLFQSRSPSLENTNNPNSSEIPRVVVTKDGPYYVCECYTRCNSRVDLERHRQGPRCRRKLQRYGEWHQTQHSETNNTITEPIPCDRPTYCDICKTVIPEGPENKRVHENGLKHKKKKEQLENFQFMTLSSATFHSISSNTYHGQPQLNRRNSLESELSEAPSDLSYVTANSEISPLSQTESSYAHKTEIQQEITTEEKKGETNSFTETSESFLLSKQLHQSQEKVDRLGYKRGRGYCLIINQTNFPEGPRNGTDIDAKILEKTFQRLNFEVKVEKDLTAEDLLLNLQELCYFLNRNTKKYQLMCICLLSHGNKDMIYGVDKVEVHVMDEIVLGIFNSKNCPAMINKPKIFISNACRGEKELLGVKVRRIIFFIYIT